MQAPVAAVPGPRDVQLAEHELRDRTITGLVTIVPVLAVGVAAWRAWEGLLRPGDLVVFGVLYVLTGLGVTVGFHRLLTHRSFKAGPVVRAILAVCGSAAIEGPVISWVADHRKHHAFPTSARHGLGRWQLDPSAAVIRGLEACGLAWDVVRVSPERQQSKAMPDGG